MAMTLVDLASAEVTTWTNKEGKSIKLELVTATGKDDTLAGVFRLPNGRMATIKASDLSEADAKLLADWKPATVAAAVAPSVFDKFLNGNLVRLAGKSFKNCKDDTKPSKYYLFYYTASWCGPCHRFTPKLVEFYNTYKPASDEFELVLVTSDRSEEEMRKYAEEMKMPWPQLRLTSAEGFKRQFRHPGDGIPNLVLTNTQGELLKTSYEGEEYLGPHVVMDHLAKLLKK